MKHDKQRRRYGGLMTEHERKVNREDIKAYQNEDVTMHASIDKLGLGYDEMQRNIQRKQMKNLDS